VDDDEYDEATADVFSVGKNGTVTIEDAATVDLCARRAIVIWPGVTIENGAEFHASISQ
jgi:hypothetical protein